MKRLGAGRGMVGLVQCVCWGRWKAKHVEGSSEGGGFVAVLGREGREGGAGGLGVKLVVGEVYQGSGLLTA